MAFGWLQESMRSLLVRYDRFQFAPFALGFLPWAVQWIVVWLHFGHAGSPPDFVWAIMVLEVVFDSLFAVWMAYSQINVETFAEVEIGYVVLSLTAKQALAWANFGGSRSL